MPKILDISTFQIEFNGIRDLFLKDPTISELFSGSHTAFGIEVTEPPTSITVTLHEEVEKI